MTAVPPGWPREVPPPGADGWQRRAVGWLFDLCPADLRAHEVLRRHPRALAFVAAGQVDAALDAARASIATARAELRDAIPPPAVAEVVAALQLEQARLEAARRALALVADALAGVRFTPRL